MRLFTGLDLPEDVRVNLSRLLELLRPAGQLRWSPVYNLHITTKFIGEWPENRLPELVDRLKPLGKRPPIDISVAGMGWFPNPHNPRVLWTGVKAGPELAQLAADTDEITGAIGVPRETKKFAPHLTLARITDRVSLTGVRQAIAELGTTDFGSFQADRFYLYLSKPGPNGSIYTKLEEISFTSE